MCSNLPGLRAPGACRASLKSSLGWGPKQHTSDEVLDLLIGSTTCTQFITWCLLSQRPSTCYRGSRQRNGPAAVPSGNGCGALLQGVGGRWGAGPRRPTNRRLRPRGFTETNSSCPVSVFLADARGRVALVFLSSSLVTVRGAHTGGAYPIIGSRLRALVSRSTRK